VRNSTSYSSLGYVLHSYPYKETSLILETFTRVNGRVAMVAKGAKRNGISKYAINPFQPITIDWFGRAELKTLKAADHDRIYPQMRGSALMAAFYVNELLLKLAVKDDPHEALFDAYDDTVAALSATQTQLAADDSNVKANKSREIESILRRFELTMLAELGYALTLQHEADTDALIDPQAEYLYIVDRGPVRVGTSVGAQTFAALEPVKLSGQTLCVLCDGALSPNTDALVLAQAKQLMRRVINHHLGDKALNTRQLIRELK
jgi:DNA repair protein RecO (recombination protein O)